MTEQVRLLDPGLKPTTWNLALSAALVERHRQGESPSTLRFQLFPPSAILGRHQILAREVNLDWCAAHGVAVTRRITGGGAIIMDPGILGWELLLPARMFGSSLAAAAERICTAVATGLSTLGMAARYRPRNDIEVEGRKLCGTGGFFDGPSLLYQGTVILRLDRDLLRNALLWPGDKLARHDVAAIDDRVTDLESVLGRAVDLDAVKTAFLRGLAQELDLRLTPGLLDPAEESLARTLMDDEIASPEFIAGSPPGDGPGVLAATRQTPGGAIAVHAKLRPGPERIIESVVFSGDFFVNPPRAILDAEAGLVEVPLAVAPSRLRTLLQASSASFLGCGPEDFVSILDETGPR